MHGSLGDMDIAHFWAIEFLQDLDVLWQLGGLVASAMLLGALVAASRTSHFVAATSVLLGLLIYGDGRLEKLVIPLGAALAFAALLAALRPAPPAEDTDPDSTAGGDVPQAPGPAPRTHVPGLALLFLALAAFGFFWVEGVRSAIDVAGPEIVGALVGGLAGLVGGYVGASFVAGAIRAGGHGITVALFFSVVVLAAGLLSFLLPVVGYLFAALVGFVAVRARRRRSRKYKGLRILS